MALALLLIEDSEADAELIAAELRGGGISAALTRAQTAAEVDAALTRTAWDLVICDYSLPGFGAMEALELLARHDAAIPFVILSGTIGEEAAVAALKAGARDVVLKTNLARLGQVVLRELHEAANRREQQRLEEERRELERRLVALNERLRASERQYRELFERNPQPTIVFDRDTNAVVAVNAAMVAKYGYAREEFLAMRITELAPSEDAERVAAFLASDPPGQRPGQAASGYPGRHQLKDGTTIDVEAVSDNLELDGRRCRIALFTDVTERNRAAAEITEARDAAVAASNTKSAFLANMSHEIRTPMNAVIGMTELLLGTALDAEQREYAEQVARSGEHTLSIVDDILDIARIEAGQLALDVEEFDVREAIERACEIVAGHARTKGLPLRVEIDTDVPERMHGDPRRFEQVVLNLAANAVKFTAAGEVAIRAHAARGPDGRLRVEVADTGIGVAPEDLERIFDAFTQVDASSTRSYGGTGLGLSIVREIVQLMGGTFGAQSTPGCGSTFWFEVELFPSPAPPAVRPGFPAERAADRDRVPLVLVAEDNEVNQLVAVRTLKRCGWHAHVVRDGREALAALAEPFDAVLMDCEMPDMDGCAVTSELRRREGEGRRTPVVGMSANVSERESARCLAAGMDDLVAKPLRHDELKAKLAPWLSPRAEEGHGVARSRSTPSLKQRRVGAQAGGSSPTRRRLSQ